MRRTFYLFIFIGLVHGFQILAQEEPQPEPQFTDAVEVISTETLEPDPLATVEEKVIYEGLIVSSRVYIDEINRAVRTLDGEAYPWPEDFERASLQNFGGLNQNIIYEGQVFLRVSVDRKTTYWTLDLGTGMYTEREDNTVDTFCGHVPPEHLDQKWIFKRDGDTVRLCSPYRNFMSSSLPANYDWLRRVDYLPGPLLISESPSGETLVVAGRMRDVNRQDFFRYDIRADKFTKLGRGVIHIMEGARAKWLTEEILLATSSFLSNYNSHDPKFNVVDLRYDDVTVLQGSSFFTQDNQVNLVEDPLRIVVSEDFYLHYIPEGELIPNERRIYCRDIVYEIMERRQRTYEFGEFCRLVGGERYKDGYYLQDKQLWRYEGSDASAYTYGVHEGPISHVQNLGDTLLLYMDDQVLRLDISVPGQETSEILLNHPALHLVEEFSQVTQSNPFMYFITPEGLLRVNPETGDEKLLFEGMISRVEWIDPASEQAALIYETIDGNYPPYISPAHDPISPFDEPLSSFWGTLAWVNLKTGDILFETSVEWLKQRDIAFGFWLTRGISRLDDGWFVFDDRNIWLRLAPEDADEPIILFDLAWNAEVLSRSEDWLLVHDRDAQTLSLMSVETQATQVIAENVPPEVTVTYEGNAEFPLTVPNQAVYRIRIPSVAD